MKVYRYAGNTLAIVDKENNTSIEASVSVDCDNRVEWFITVTRGKALLLASSESTLEDAIKAGEAALVEDAAR